MNVNDAMTAVAAAVEKNGEVADLIRPVQEYADESSGIMANSLGAEHEATKAFVLAEDKAGECMSLVAQLGAALEALNEYFASIQ